MVADPCGSTLVPGMYGSSEGLLARLKSSVHTNSGGATPNTATCGYLLWCPDYHNTFNDNFPDQPSGGNCFMFLNEDSTVHPTNSPGIGGTGGPFGSRNRAFDGYSTAATIDDPAGPLVSSDVVSDARPLSACMAMTYYGRMDESAGEVGFISNLPIEELLDGGRGGDPLSVDELMNYTNKKMRLGVDTIESVYRLNDGSSEHFRAYEDSMYSIQPGATTVVSNAKVLSPRVFGIVWRRTQPGAGLTFDLTKSIEWRAEASSGITQTPIHTYSRSKVPQVNAKLDTIERRGHPIWDRVVTTGKSLVSQISQMALSGTGQLVARGATKRIGSSLGSALRVGMAEAPLLLM